MDDITTSPIKNFNTLLDCPVRFSGEFNEQKIHCFVEYIEYYKRIKSIRDEQALLELQYLLVNNAYNWWVRRKANIGTWSEALTILENQYSKKRPANKIYQEILKYSYEDYQSKQDFIDDKIELFAELALPELTEKAKSYIIYALLPNDVQNEIKLEDVTSLKDFKKHLRFDEATAVLNSETSHFSTILVETDNTRTPSKDSANEVVNSQISFEKDGNGDSERSAYIKVRRTEDLMPRDVKMEDKSSEDITSNETNTSATNNNTLRTSTENFQIDSDIMNQINNIIDETEMCIEAINNNEGISSTLTQSTNSAINLEFQGFQIESAKQIETENHESASQLNSTRKTKKRCTYCRRFNHTAQSCLKRAKQMKLFPERFLATKDNNDLNETDNAETSQISKSNISINKPSVLNAKPTEISVATPNNSNPVSNTTTTIDPSATFTSSSPAILNNAAEKSINSLLTTILIPPINGKAPNKILAAKLRNTTSPSPKCHQCGTLGFYKSICPNCSPIYNNNSHK